MIVWVASYPRSGNTFARSILFNSFGLKSGSQYPEPPDRYPSIAPLALRPEELESASSASQPVFVKTHDLPDPKDASPALYLVRDGRDALASYAHFARKDEIEGFERLSLQEALEALIRGGADSPFGSWSQNVSAWSTRSAPTAILRFEELIKARDPAELLAQRASSIGVALSAPRTKSPDFKRLQALDPLLFPRGQVGAWKSELPPALEDVFWELHGEQMVALGYSRDHPQ